MDKHELNAQLMKSWVAARPLENNGQWYNPQADVIQMLGHCLKSIATSFQSNAWPELMELLAKEASDRDALMEELRSMHFCVADMIRWISDEQPDEHNQVDGTIYESLERVGWNEIPPRARVGYLAMLGLYHLSRVWVVGRQHHRIGVGTGTPFEQVATAAGLCMRWYDQQLAPHDDGNAVLKAAVLRAKQCGLTPAEIRDRVNYVLTASESTDLPSSDALTQLGDLTLTQDGSQHA